MDDTQKERMRTYAWNYFAYHAEQRMKAFNFYLILVSAIIAALVTIASKIEPKFFWTLSPLGFLLSYTSIMFGLLDRRNKELVRNGEAALRFLDEEEGHGKEKVPHVLKIFAKDDHVTSGKDRFPLLQTHISYSTIFRMIFWTFGLIGFAGGVLCIIGGRE